MKNFIKVNWFKLAILILLLGVILLVIFVLIIRPEFERRKLVEKQESEKIEKLNNPKSDSYVVLYNNIGEPITWLDIINKRIMFEKDYTTYRDAVPSLEQEIKTQESALSNVPEIIRTSKALGYDTSKTLILKNYIEESISACKDLIVYTSGMEDYYDGLLKSIDSRNAELYKYYSEKISELGESKEKLLNNYVTTKEDRIQYAKEYSMSY